MRELLVPLTKRQKELVVVFAVKAAPEVADSSLRAASCGRAGSSGVEERPRACALGRACGGGRGGAHRPAGMIFAEMGLASVEEVQEQALLFRGRLERAGVANMPAFFVKGKEFLQLNEAVENRLKTLEARREGLGADAEGVPRPCGGDFP